MSYHMYMIDTEREYIKTPEAVFAQATEDLSSEGRKNIREQFENNPNPLLNLAYHREEHARLVAERSAKILQAIQSASPRLVSSRDIALVKLLGTCHDEKQLSQAKEVPIGEEKIIKRERDIGENEKQSALLVIKRMQRKNVTLGRVVFTPDDMYYTVESYLATIPGFDSKLCTVIQPYLTRHSSLFARAIALSDLGTAGMDDPEKCVKEGDAVFREEQMDIHIALLSGEMPSEKTQAFWKDRLLTWTAFQEKFIAGREEMLPYELEGLPQEVKPAVAELFTNFEDAKRCIADRLEHRRTMSIPELLLDYGYIPA